ncbi:unnamed protein product [Durusdinium trenchii]|uniref:Uncharacterized protein n=1 Tax=Durusdinium trenchii TaxID=1381693 RepID=A0ABP0L402_9DINO
MAICFCSSSGPGLGKGKAMPPKWKNSGQGNDDWQEDFLSAAVTQALEPILTQETEWDQAKLEKRVKQYFRNAAKNLEFNVKPWQELVEEYCDHVFASLFQALKERPWLTQVDFLMVVDAGVKELFPPYLLQHVPQLVFEQQVLSAHDRAFEEQRFAPMLWDTLFERIEDKAQKSRIYNALEAARKEAAMMSGEANAVENFLKAWVACSLREMLSQSKVPLEQDLPPELCRDIFHALIEAGALPLPLTQEGVPPESLVILDQAIEDGYAGNLPVPPAPTPKPKGKTAPAAYRPPTQNSVYKEPRVPTSAPVFNGKGGATLGLPRPAVSVAKGAGAAKGAGQFTPRTPGWQNPFSSQGQKRPLEQSFGGGKNGGAAPPAKWQKKPDLSQMNFARGHHLCTQKEDCIGDNQSALVQHVDDGVPGDLYCTACWAVFADADETLNAIPFDN